MWLFHAMMWLHERNGWDTRVEERPQQSHRARRSGRADHDHSPGQASGEDRLYREVTKNGGADRGRDGQAGQWLPTPAETDQAPRPWQDSGGVRLRRPSLSLYLDTSALVKLLVDEPDSDVARDAFGRASAAATSALTQVEAVSALTRARKGRRISAAQLRAGLRNLEKVWPKIDVHAVTAEVLRQAEHAAGDHALRAYDSLHLATALRFSEIENTSFACWDRELREAARKHGFALVPVQV